jgi:hypothetical protein
LNTLGFGFISHHNAISIALSFPANALGFSLRGNLYFLLVDFLSDDFFRPQSFHLGGVLSLLDGYFCLAFGYFCPLQGCSLLDRKLSIVVGNIRIGSVFTLYGLRFLSLNVYTLTGCGFLPSFFGLSSGLSDSNFLLAICLGFTDSAKLFLLGYINFRFVDGLGGRFLINT